MLRAEKGITLVALIITIIILVILAAVSIATVTQMGIVQYTQQGAYNYADAAKRENEMLKDTQNFMSSAANEIVSRLKEKD